MRARILIILGLAAIPILALVAIALFWIVSLFSARPPSRIALKLGDDWQTIRAHSTYPIPASQDGRTGYSTRQQQVDFEYNDPAHSLALPESRGIFFQLAHDRVDRIHVLQYGEVEPWDVTAQIVRDLVRIVEAAGWERARQRGDADALLARARAYYDNATFQNMMNDFSLGVWRTGNARLEIGLYRVRKAGESWNGRVLPENLYSINLRIVQE